MTAVADLVIEKDAAIPTWFGIGGRADRLARPENVEKLRRCVIEDPKLRMLGDGANLLVDDDGVGELVVALTDPAFTSWRRDERSGRIVAMAGANLPKLIVQMVRDGLAGLEGLAGIPATLGGAVVMNAGGAFGQIADTVARVWALDRNGRDVVLDRDEIDFSYRHSGLNGLIIVSVELELPEEDPAVLRERLKEVMEYKSGSQPMKEHSAGCVFKNPTLTGDIEGIGAAGDRVSAGMLIDKAGLKGLRCGGASVSQRHANFMVTGAEKLAPGVGGSGGSPPPHARARDVITLMEQVRARVFDRFGLWLDPEVVIWRR